MVNFLCPFAVPLRERIDFSGGCGDGFFGGPEDVGKNQSKAQGGKSKNLVAQRRPRRILLAKTGQSKAQVAGHQKRLISKFSYLFNYNNLRLFPFHKLPCFSTKTRKFRLIMERSYSVPSQL